MAGMMNKIGETLHMGGKKEEEKNHGEGHKAPEVHHAGEEHKKEGMVDKIKDKIHGEGTTKTKTKKEKKKKEHGHEHDEHGHSSSSDSD